MMFAWLRGPWLRGHFNLEQTNKGDGADSGLCVICERLGIGDYISYDRKTDPARRFLSLEVEVLGLVLCMQCMMIWIARSQ